MPAYYTSPHAPLFSTKQKHKIQSIIYAPLNPLLYSDHMFWNKNKKTDKRKKAKDLQNGSKEGIKKQHSQSLAGDELRAQALANARIARENLGEDTIQRIAEIMKDKEKSPLHQAKAKIAAADQRRVEDSIRDLLDE